MPGSAELLAFAGFGIAIMLVAWLPLWLDRVPLTLPMLAVGAGYLAFALIDHTATPSSYPYAARLLPQVVLIVAVMGAGLKIDRRISWRGWTSAWRLLGLVMPISIALLAVLGCLVLGVSPGVGVLLAAVLAPTDPVLAASVQVARPGIGEEGETRFALTAEAGLNDGLGLPFLLLGAAMIAHDAQPGPWMWHWLGVDLLANIALAVAIGFAIGWVLVHGNRLLPERMKLSRSSEGLASIGVAFVVYAAASSVHADGLVAVFVAAITIRNLGDALDYAQRLSATVGRLERLLAFLVLGLFGGVLASGLLANISWRDIVYALLALLVVRPVAVLAGFVFARHPAPVRLALGYFGIRGLGSLYYVGYAAVLVGARAGEVLWRVTALTVLFSVVLYGFTAPFVLRLLDRAMQDAKPSGVQVSETGDLRLERERRKKSEQDD